MPHKNSSSTQGSTKVVGVSYLNREEENMSGTDGVRGEVGYRTVQQLKICELFHCSSRRRKRERKGMKIMIII